MTRRAAQLSLLIVVLGGCVEEPVLEPCEIATRQCQEDVYYALLRMRGDGIDAFNGLPPIETLTADAYRQQLEERAEAASERDADDGQADAINPWDRALQLLGLLTIDTSPTQASIDDRVRNVVAFYSSSTRKITVIDHGDSRDRIDESRTLLHELVHALQDRNIGLGAPPGANTDRRFSYRSLIEGEATHYARLGVAEMQGEPADEIDWEGEYDRWIGRQRRRVVESGSPYLTVSRWFLYPLGARLMARHWRDGGNAALRHLWRNAPTTSSALMRGELDAQDGESGALHCEVVPPDDDFRATGVDRFGAIQLFGLFTAHGVGAELAWELATRWRDDRLWLYHDDATDRVALSWRIRFGSPDDVADARDALDGARGLELGASERDLRINVASEAELAASWEGAADCR